MCLTMTRQPDAIDSFNQMFDRFLSTNYSDDSSPLHSAIRYCLGGQGKKVRARLAMMVCSSYGQSNERAYAAAAAVEMVHAYSLAHDDLPCMDDDNFRRGRPALHRAFDEATALLAGDAVLTDAFRILADEKFFDASEVLPATDRLRQVAELAAAAGGHGMVLGQALDMTWTGRKGYDKGVLDAIHTGKTGALIGAACAVGAIAAGAQAADVHSWRSFGILTGLAFQAVDDTLDKQVGTGKTSGKDDAQGKLTYLTFFNSDLVRQMAMEYTGNAAKLIPASCEKKLILEFVESLVYRGK